MQQPIIKQLKKYSRPLPRRDPFCVFLASISASAQPKDVSIYLKLFNFKAKDIRFGVNRGREYLHFCFC